MINLLAQPHRLNRMDMTCRAVAETPKGSCSKFDYEEASELFELTDLPPGGMSFPLDFGFFPSTKAEDGDPLDILVLHDEPTPVGAQASIRLTGVIEAEETEAGAVCRNDLRLAITTCSHQYDRVRQVEAQGDTFLDHLTQFWVNYNALEGKGFALLGVSAPAATASALEKATVGRAS